MTIATCISLIGEPNSSLYNSILEANTFVQKQLFELVEEQFVSSKFIYDNYTEEDIYNNLTLIYENAYKKRKKAIKNKNIKSLNIWSEVLDIIDLAFNCFENIIRSKLSC